jgi:hypothetical protein
MYPMPDAAVVDVSNVTASPERHTVRTVVGVALLALVFLLMAPSHARADCDVLDSTCAVETVDDATGEVVETVGDSVVAVEETTDEIVDTVEGAVDDVVETVDGVVDTVEETVGGVEDTVEDTVGGVEDTVEDTVGAVTDTVDDAVGIDDVVDPVPPAAPDAPDVPETPGSDDPPGGRSNPDPEPSVVRPDSQGRSRPAVLRGVLASSGGGTLGHPITAEELMSAPFDPFGPFAGSLSELARRLAFPLVLVALLLGFVAVQNRLDRRDPKLALAATTPDVLNFA